MNRRMTINVFPYAPNDPLVQINWKMTDTTELVGSKISTLKFMDKNGAVHVYGTKLASIIHISGSTGQSNVVKLFMTTLFLSLLISGA